MSDVQPAVRVQAAPLDMVAEQNAFASGRSDIGAIVSFTGICRDEAGRLSLLEIEHYPEMAEAEIARIAEDACSRWPVAALTVIHRHGPIRPGEVIVLVMAASAHRQAAFDAAGFMMDYLKTNAPFWKREHGPDGEPGNWVAAKADDNRRVERWRDDDKSRKKTPSSPKAFN